MKFLTIACFTFLAVDATSQSSRNKLHQLRFFHVSSSIEKWCSPEELSLLSRVSKGFAQTYTPDLALRAKLTQSDVNLWSFINQQNKVGFLQRCFALAPEKLVNLLEGAGGRPNFFRWCV